MYIFYAIANGKGWISNFQMAAIADRGNNSWIYFYYKEAIFHNAYRLFSTNKNSCKTGMQFSTYY
jgi:hypothetical protein